MFSTSNIDNFAPEILKRSVDCTMQSCSNEEILQILKQRTSFLHWGIESDDVLNNIVKICNGQISLAIMVLNWSYKTARSEGTSTSFKTIRLKTERFFSLALSKVSLRTWSVPQVMDRKSPGILRFRPIK